MRFKVLFERPAYNVYKLLFGKLLRRVEFMLHNWSCSIRSKLSAKIILSDFSLAENVESVERRSRGVSKVEAL
jgi:hypothetical protein